MPAHIKFLPIYYMRYTVVQLVCLMSCEQVYVTRIQYLSEHFHPAYLVFAQQYFGGESWGADIMRSGIRCDRYQCPNFAVLSENYEYVIAELCTDDLC